MCARHSALCLCNCARDRHAGVHCLGSLFIRGTVHEHYSKKKKKDPRKLGCHKGDVLDLDFKDFYGISKSMGIRL